MANTLFSGHKFKKTWFLVIWNSTWVLRVYGSVTEHMLCMWCLPSIISKKVLSMKDLRSAETERLGIRQLSCDYLLTIFGYA